MAEVITEQNLLEFDWYCDVLKREGVRSHLEIGSRRGGSLLAVARALPVPSRLVAVDLGDNLLPSVLECLQLVVKQITAMGHAATLVIGDSTDPNIVKTVQRLGPFDSCFIDGNHSLVYVAQDFENYGAMSKLVAFHDIGWQPKPGSTQIDVPEFWQQVKTKYPNQEIKLNQRKNGIGVLWRK